MGYTGVVFGNVVVIMQTKRDLDSPAAISDFVESFYNQLLADKELSPIFVDTAKIELEHHLPKIKAFWRKLLLGETGYNSHMMNIHRDVHQQQAFTARHFSRWLSFFEATLDESFQGPYTERARNVARSIATNLQEALLNPADYSQRTRYIEERAQPIGSIRKPA